VDEDQQPPCRAAGTVGNSSYRHLVAHEWRLPVSDEREYELSAAMNRVTWSGSRAILTAVLSAHAPFMADNQSVTGWLDGLKASDEEAARALWRNFSRHHGRVNELVTAQPCSACGFS
jgi:hypothetical protein